MTPELDTGRTRKGERTKAAILEAALELFRERGFEAATMRAVAERAGVSVGNAYYYFESKEHLIQAFYGRSHQDHLKRFEPLLARERAFKELLRQLLRTKVETSEPYHRFAGLLFKTAADPRSPLNPFSAESSEVREDATALLERVVRESGLKVPDDLRPELPNLLWLYEMAIILFWIHDESEGRARTYRLIDRTVDIVTNLLTVSKLPLMGPLRKTVPRLLADLRAPGADVSDAAKGERPQTTPDPPR